MPWRLFLPLPPAYVFSWIIGWSADQIKRQSLCRVQERHQDTHLSPRKGTTGEYSPSMCSPVFSLLSCFSLCWPVCLSASSSVPACLRFGLSASLSVCLCFCVPVCLSVDLHVSLSSCLSLCWPLYCPAYLPVDLSVSLLTCLSSRWSYCLSLLNCLTLCWPVVSLLSCSSLCCPLCLSVDLGSLLRPFCLSGTLQQSRCVCKSSAVSGRKEEVDAFPHFLYGGDGGAAGWDTCWHHQYLPFTGDPPFY